MEWTGLRGPFVGAVNNKGRGMELKKKKCDNEKTCRTILPQSKAAKKMHVMV